MYISPNETLAEIYGDLDVEKDALVHSFHP